jgi:hypothetical protein
MCVFVFVIPNNCNMQKHNMLEIYVLNTYVSRTVN